MSVDHSMNQKKYVACATSILDSTVSLRSYVQTTYIRRHNSNAVQHSQVLLHEALGGDGICVFKNRFIYRCLYVPTTRLTQVYWPRTPGPEFLARNSWHGFFGPEFLARNWSREIGLEILAWNSWPRIFGPEFLARNSWPGILGREFLVDG